MDNDFDSVSWQNDAENDSSRPTTAGNSQPDDTTHTAKSSGKRKASNNSAQAGADADPVDLAGIGDGRLDCTVDTPLKENDGTKDAYVSYLVTTNVRFCRIKYPNAHRSATSQVSTNEHITDRLRLLPKIHRQSSSPFHRLRFPLQSALSRIPSMRRPPSPRQAQNGIRPRRPLRT